MSTGVCGIVRTNIHDVEYKVNLAFYFEKRANELEIGTKMGGNISRNVYDKYADERGKGGIIFELTDSPLDNHADDLFGVEYIGDRESLFNRMKRVQMLFEPLLNYENVIQIDLVINYLFEESEDDNVIYIRLSEFCEKVTEIYRECDMYLPVAKLKIVH